MHNDTYFTKPPPTHMKQWIDKPSNPINQYLQTEHTIKFLSTLILHRETKMTPHDIIYHTINEPLLPQTTNLDDRIKKYKDKLFFVSYIPEGNVRARCYLIQVDLDITFKNNPAHKFNHQYECALHAKDDCDKKKSDKYSRWWPEWWTYTINTSSNINIYQQRIQSPPNHRTDHKSISNGMEWSIYLILHPLQDLSILNPFIKPTTQDQTLAAMPGRYAIKLVPTVTCSLQPLDTKLPTNHLSKNYLKPGKENLPQTKYWNGGKPHLCGYESWSISDVGTWEWAPHYEHRIIFNEIKTLDRDRSTNYHITEYGQ